MNAIQKLEDKNVPLLAKAWMPNGDRLGVTREGHLIVVARIVGEQEDSIFNPIPEGKKRASRKPRPTAADETDNAEAPDTLEN